MPSPSRFWVVEPARSPGDFAAAGRFAAADPVRTERPLVVVADREADGGAVVVARPDARPASDGAAGAALRRAAALFVEVAFAGVAALAGSAAPFFAAVDPRAALLCGAALGAPFGAVAEPARSELPEVDEAAALPAVAALVGAPLAPRPALLALVPFVEVRPVLAGAATVALAPTPDLVPAAGTVRDLRDVEDCG